MRVMRPVASRLMMACRNSSGESSRPCARTLSWYAAGLSLNGGAPMAPPATCRLLLRRAVTISVTVRSRLEAFSGSIHTRIA
jgi:hypothetical protein